MPLRLMFGMLLVVLALALAACGGGDDDDDGAGGGQTPVATKDGGGDSGDSGGETPGAENDDDDEATPEPGDGDGAAEIDACALVTAGEAEDALGASVGEGESENFPSFYGCRYETEGFDYVDVTVVVFASSEEARVTYEQVLDINDYPVIDGLGDRAYDSRPIIDVTAQKGKYEVSVDILTLEDEADFGIAKDLMQKALGRLP